LTGDRLGGTALATGAAGAPYEAGLLALREGALLEAAVRGLRSRPEVLMVNATGRDHPRRAGLAVHLGALLELPTVGVTHRPLLAGGRWPEPVPGARSPLLLEGQRVGYWVCTRPGTRPLAVHAAWRTDPETALAVVLRATTGGARTPQPIRQARRIAREARTAAASAGRP
jgi:deoxyribonuclease V